MSAPQALKKILLFLPIFFAVLGLACASEDGFGQAMNVSGQYFTVYYSPALEVDTLSKELNIGTVDKILAGEPSRSISNSPKNDLAGMLDVLFMRVGDILDMHLYNFHGTIKICADDKALSAIYSNLFDAELGNRFSFYAYSLNTIYISSQHFTREILGHEIAHAIISNYFVVSPPIKASEVLAGYVEYQLRKP